MTFDVLIAGAGPAALLAATALAERGLSVQVVGGVDRPWTARYGDFLDALQGVGLGDDLAHVWPETAVQWDETPHRLGRGYGSVDGVRLRQRLLAQLDDASRASVVWDTVLAVSHGASASTVTLGSGRQVRATLVLDATGSGSTLTQRQGAGPTVYQSAYGAVVRTLKPVDPTVMGFMDWRQPPAIDGLADTDPSFLYAMPLSEHEVFFEETCLRRGPAMPLQTLQRRLWARLHGLGLIDEVPTEVRDEEQCVFPMDVPLPRRDQRTVALGAAASVVHPATGYSLVRSASIAPRLADKVARALQDGLEGQALSAVAWRAVWPAPLRARDALARAGAAQLDRLDAEALPAFFAAFFDLPGPLWHGYLAAEGSVATVTRAMWGVFMRVDAPTRWQLMGSVWALPEAALHATGLLEVR